MIINSARTQQVSEEPDVILYRQPDITKSQEADIIWFYQNGDLLVLGLLDLGILNETIDDTIMNYSHSSK